MSEIDNFLLAFNNAYFAEKSDIIIISIREQVRGRSRSDIEAMCFNTSGLNGMLINFTIDCLGNINTCGFSSFSMDDLREMYIVTEEWRKDN